MPEKFKSRRKPITTSASARAAKPDRTRQVDYPDSKIGGLALRITPAGKRTWTLRYRTLEGAQRRITLGTFPAQGIADARLAANKVLHDAAKGGDPARERQSAKASARSRRLNTVSDLIDQYFLDAEKGLHRPNARAKRKSTLELERAYYTRLIRPRFAKRPIEELSRAEIQQFLNKVSETAPASARHCRNVIRQAYNYAIRNEIAQKNPAQLTALAMPVSRDRVLTDDELRAIWRGAQDPAAHAGLHISTSMGLALCLAMVTLQRAGEVCGIHVDEISHATTGDKAGSNAVWTLPGQRTKNHRTHIVPLSPLALEIIEEVRALDPSESGYIFASPRNDGPITRHALSRAMKRLTQATGISNATVHDFRRTGSTNITSERIGRPRFIVSRVLNQISDTGGAAAVTGVYDRNEYLVEKRRALEAWAQLLEEVVYGIPRTANVIELKR